MVKTVALIFCIGLNCAAQTLSPTTVWFNKAEEGDAHAQFWLGVAYESGRGIKQDFAEAIRWLGKSAKQGNPDAQFLIGQMWEDGEGLPEDYVKAAEWYRLACENRPDHGGAGQGCNGLGNLYPDGKGVKRNLVQAYMYFKIAGNELSLDTVKSRMTGQEIDKAERLTDRWKVVHPDQ